MEDIHIKHALILKEVKHEFFKVIREDPKGSLYMVDAIQRLGIEYLFEEEIEEALQKQNLILGSQVSDSNHDHDHDHQLYEVALQFRLLRQGGHYVHADVFDSFKSKEGKLKDKYSEDIKGLIALYEASQLSIEGEDSLDHAGYLSCQLLEAWLSRHQDHDEAIIVANTLQHSLHNSLPRFMDRSIFLRDFLARNGWTSLEELAEINSSIIKCMNQNEIIAVSKWWKDLRMAKEMMFSRYQPIKWYIWPMVCLTDPQFSEQRIELTKPVALVYIIDDIFDVYGTLEELTLFTNAVNRWEFQATEQLPDYMNICFNVLYDITNELATKVHEKHGLNPINTLKKSWAALLNSFLVEAQWLNSGHLPKAEEYLKNGIVSTGVHVVFLHAFFLLDQNITIETIAIMDEIPSIATSVGKILRLCDDLEGAKSDDQEGLDGSYLECYMNEHEGVPAEDTQRHVAHLISNAWKRLNQQTLTPNQFTSSFSKFCLNAARMVPLMYQYCSNRSLSNLQEHVKSLLDVSGGRIAHPLKITLSDILLNNS